jgi:hypothetical protein
MNAGETLVDVDQREGRLDWRTCVHFTIRISLRSMESATAAMIIRP